MPITALPTPPTRSDPANFASRADAFLAALPTFQAEANALQTDVNSKQTTASTAATTATTQAGIATTQANTATTQAGLANTAKVAAELAETNAEAAQAAAQAALDSFDDRYLGAKASDPTLDNDGAALLVGAMYWNTATSELRFWSGSAWVTVNLSATTYAVKANNLSDLASVATARSNLNVPTRTGGDASGSWGISVTGSSASCTGNAATATSATNATNATNATTSTTQASSVSSTAIATTAYVKSLFGAATVSGTLDWNHATNTKPGVNPVLLMGNATNGPGVASYYHSLVYEHVTKDGTGNLTQFAISYADHKDMWFRGRMGGVWNAWARILHSENYNAFAPSLTGAGASGSWAIDITGTASGGTSGNAATATALQTARTLWGQSFSGVANVTGAMSGVTTLSMTGQLTNTLATGTAPFAITSTTRVANLNVATAGTADTLTTPRAINGTSFNGSAAITTASWGTARTITLGSTGKSVDGSAAVTWTLAEMGAAAAADTVNLVGDQTVAGIKTLTGATVIQRNTVAPVYSSGHLELRTTDLSSVSLGFHRSGATACQLRHDSNGLILSGSSQTAAADFYAYGNITAAGAIYAGGAVTGNNLVYLSGDQTIAGVKTFSGTADFTGVQRGGIVAVAALDIACGSGNYFTKTINGASTFTFSGAPASRAYSFTLELTHTSGTITWPAAVQWPGGSAPSLTTGKTHLFTFVTDDGGTRWRGVSSVNYTN